MFGGELKPAGRGQGDLAELAHDAAQSRMAQAFLHGDEHVGVVAGLDEDHSVGVKSRQLEGRREEVAPAQTPEDDPFEAREDAGQEDGRRRVVGQVRASRHVVERAGSDPAAGQMPVDRLDAEGERLAASARILDPRDARAQLIKDGGLAHGIMRLGGKICSLFVHT